jgi:hypothetical protein
MPALSTQPKKPMKSDISRITFDPRKHFSRVLMQQGRVQLDADWNEQASILLHYLRTLAADLVGPHSGPVNQCGFKIASDTQGFSIGKGRYYVDGFLCENEEDVPYAGQVDYPLPDDAKLENLSWQYVAYLDVWERHISCVEDESIREVALDGPESATRAKVVWQVKLLKLDSGSVCVDGANLLRKLAERHLPKLRARVKPEAASTKPCVVSPDSRYRGPENQLYRVEIHKVSDDGKATFKWSRENGSVVLPILDLKTGGATGQMIVTLAHLGRDAKLGVAIGDWVELVNDDYALQNRAENLLRIEAIDRVERTVTLIGDSNVTAEQSKHPLLRRWDHQAGDKTQDGLTLEGGAVKVVEGTDTKWLNLEDGVQIQFETGGIYRTGDYWLIPARTATGKVEWPDAPGIGDPVAAALPPHGIVHHYAPLAIISVAGGDVTLEHDCRCQFEPLRCTYGYHYGALGIGPDWPE